MCAITVDAAQKQRLDDPIEVHNRPFVSQRSMRHKNNDLTTPWRFTFGALPSRSIRHKNNHSTTSGGSHSARCRFSRYDTKTITWRPHRGSHSARCHHGRCDTKTMTWRPHRGSHSARCRHGRCGTKTMTW